MNTNVCSRRSIRGGSHMKSLKTDSAMSQPSTCASCLAFTSGWAFRQDCHIGSAHQAEIMI